MRLDLSKEQKDLGIFVAVSVVAMAGLYFVDRVLDHPPEPNIECTITAPVGQPSPLIRTTPSPIRKVDLTGFLDRPHDNYMWDFDGSAVVHSDKESDSLSARGKFFLDQNRQVESVLVDVERELFAPNALSLVTLNDDGILDTDREKLFAYESKEFKQSYPMTYRCKVDVDRLGLEAGEQRKRDLLDRYLPWLG